jgi:TolB protein
MQNGAEFRGRIKKRLAAVGRGLRRLGRRILAAPVGLVRLGARLPGLLWRGFKGLLRFLISFLISLPSRLGRGLKWLLRFLIHLPGRLWRGLKWLLRLLVSLPGRLWRGIASLPGRLALALYRLRLRWREWRARFAAWRRSRALRPRLLSPRTQRLILLTLIVNLSVISLLSLTLVHLSRREPETIVVTATPAHTGALPVAQVTPTAPTDLPPDNPSNPPAASASIGGDGAVAFALRQDGNSDIYVRKLDDNQRLRLTYHPAPDREPAWAPDGETLAFVSQRGNNWDIYRLDLVSGVLIRLTRHLHYDAHPSWSPDGAFIAFESYRSGNLDVFIMAADGSQVLQLTSHQAADFAPAWSPDGRHIAFVSYRDGSKDIFLYPLDAGSESAVVNLTQTPDRDESAPAWSPDGNHLAFSVGRPGEETIYLATFDHSGKSLDEGQTRVFNPGTEPVWSPDGKSLIYTQQHAGRAFLIADSVSEWEAEQEIYNSELPVRDPSWGLPTVDPQIVAQQRQAAPMAASALYIEEIQPTPESPPPYFVVALQDVNGGDDREFLSDRVNDSFESLRQRVLEETGTDYLAAIGDSFRRITVTPPPGQSPYSWHKAGRAFDLNQGLYEREDQLIELVREDIGLFTYWRVYLRAARQDGSLGEPLHQAPWDLKARLADGLAAREGGESLTEVPLGYYVDFTQLALDYGWERVPANSRWRDEWVDINWWQFQKPQSLSWPEAMLEIYRLDQIEAVFGPLSEQDR